MKSILSAWLRKRSTISQRGRRGPASSISTDFPARASSYATSAPATSAPAAAGSSAAAGSTAAEGGVAAGERHVVRAWRLADDVVGASWSRQFELPSEVGPTHAPEPESSPEA